jgi:hypothetical protein
MSKLLGVSVTSTSTSIQHELGLKAFDPANPQNIYQYVRADDAVAQYDAVMLDTAAAGSGDASDVPFLVTPTAAADDVIEGIAQVAIAAGSYGFILIDGDGSSKAAATVVAGAPAVTIATAGTLDDTAAAAGNALATAAGRGVVFTSTTTGGVASVRIR